ncbi:MAG: hypothetical protein GC137_07080 [Alphaproteobacteria bacterium]|nr:hypothetical protein [Alphaproteobacteria bacterium]
MSFTAQAGFEWTPPENQKSSSMEEITKPLPPVISHTVMPETTTNPPVEADNIEISKEPVPVSETPETSEQVEETSTKPSGSLSINPYPLEGKEEAEASDTSGLTPPTPPAEAEAKEQPAQAEEMPAEQKSEYAVIQGFGTEMPLALALTQIVPAEFAYSFGENINAGTPISWQGGKPWDVVLQEALAPLDIKVQIISKTVVLKTKMDKEASSNQNSAAPKTAFIPDEANTVEEIIGATAKATPDENQIVVLDPDAAEEPAVIETEKVEKAEGITEIAAAEEIKDNEKTENIAEEKFPEVIVEQPPQETAKIDIERKNIEPVPIRDNIKGLEEEKKIAKTEPVVEDSLKKKLLLNLKSIISA